MKVLKSKLLKGIVKTVAKGNKYGRKNPKKSIAIAGTSIIGTSLGLGFYGNKIKEKKKNV